MTSRMQQRAREFGRVIFFDATAQLNVYGFPTYSPTVKDGEGKLRTLAYAVFAANRAAAHIFVLDSMVKIVPELSTLCHTVFTDAGVSEETIRAIFPNLRGAFVCCFHLTVLDLPQNLGSLPCYNEMKKYFVNNLLHAKSIPEFDASWEFFKIEFPAAANYIGRVWIPIRHRWADP